MSDNDKQENQKNNPARFAEFDGYSCPKCKTGKLLVIARFPRSAYDTDAVALSSIHQAYK